MVDDGGKEVGRDKEEMELEDVEDDVEEQMEREEQVDEEQQESMKDGFINILNETEDDIDISIEEAALDETVEDLYEAEAEETNMAAKMEIDAGQINPALSSSLEKDMIMAKMNIGLITRKDCDDLADLSNADSEDTVDDQNSQPTVDSSIQKKFREAVLVIEEEPSKKVVDVVQEQVEEPEAVAPSVAVGSMHGDIDSIMKTDGKELNKSLSEENTDSDSTDDSTEEENTNENNSVVNVSVEEDKERGSEMSTLLTTQTVKPENSKNENTRNKVAYFYCPMCLYIVDKKEALRVHLSTAHYQSIILAKFTTDMTSLTCTVCGKLCTSLAHLARHLGSYHRKLKEITTIHWKVPFLTPLSPDLLEYHLISCWPQVYSVYNVYSLGRDPLATQPCNQCHKCRTQDCVR